MARPKAPAPPPEIIRAVREARSNPGGKKLIPWIGAGFSQPLGFPNMKGLLKKILDDLEQTRSDVMSIEELPDDTRKQVQKIRHYREQLEKGKLDFAEIASQIREESFDPERDHEFYSTLRKVLYKVDKKAKDSSLGHYFLQMLDCKWFVTTNYDRLIERHVVPTASVVTGADEKAIAYYRRFESEEQIVFKLHGDLQRPDTIPFSDEDFKKRYRQEKSGQVLPLLKELVEKHIILFIGTSLSRSEKYFDYLESTFESMRSSRPENLSAGAPGPHFILLVEPENEIEKEMREKHFARLGVKPIWYQTDDDDHTQVWEFISNVAARTRPNLDASSLNGKEYRAAFLSSERPEYLRQQLTSEESAALVSFITPGLTNALATTEYIGIDCRRELQFKGHKEWLDDVIKVMLARRDNLYQRVKDETMEVRALCSEKKVKEDFEAAAAKVRLSSGAQLNKAREALARQIRRYEEVLDIASTTRLDIRMSDAVLAGKNLDGFLSNSYALIVVPDVEKGSADMAIAFATQADGAAFQTHLVEANSALVTERAARAEKLWWSATPEAPTLRLIQSFIDKYSELL